MSGIEPGDNGQGHIDAFDETQDIDEDDLVVIVDEDGTERSCVVLVVAEIDGSDFALLAPQDQITDDEGEVLELFIFRYDHDDEGVETYTWVEDGPTYDKVKDFFSTLMEQEE